MKSWVVSIFIITVFNFNCIGQVTNYAIQFLSDGVLETDNVSELNELQNYTVQFWINPTEWNSNATVFSRGSSTNLFELKLLEENSIQLSCGDNLVTVNSDALQTGVWSQVTIVAGTDKVSVYINDELAEEQSVTMTIPSSTDDLKIGGNNFLGKIDEFRIWNTNLQDDFFFLWRNTINKHHPNWDNLILYYKFDQNLCDNVVDYTFEHHAMFSGDGVSRIAVTDNEKFKYRKSVAYTNFARWADRQIDKDKYLLSNDLIVLSLEVDEDGYATIPYPYNEGVVSNGGYLSEYNGREGVLNLNGEGAVFNVGPNAFNPTDKYSFSTWIYLEEWTEGAFIFKKEISDNQGFSIRLGAESTNNIIIRVNGVEYSRPYKMESNKWVHFGVAAYSTTNYQVYQTSFNGVTTYAVNPLVDEHDYTVSGLESTDALIGLNINGKLDETVIWDDYRSSANMASAMTSTPLPSNTEKVEAVTLATMDSYWSYNDPENIGYDSYSYKNFINIIRSNYEGYRGFMIRGGFSSFDGWQDRFADAGFRETFASEVARVAEEFDGIDLDFEWCYLSTCWQYYGLLIDLIRDQFPRDKVFTVTPHYVSYALPEEYIASVDYFPFQIYGPGKTVFLWDTYKTAYSNFITNGYPNEKIVLSYATTTSKGYDPDTDAQLTGVPPTGIRNLFDDDYTPDMNSMIDTDGYRRYITGYNQVIDRCEFIHDNDLGGIMYWDMGNDVNTSHEYSLVKAAAYSLNSNIDTLVTEVDFITTGVNDIKEFDNTIHIYPNPVENSITIMLPYPEEIDSVKIFNLKGSEVLSIANSLNQVDVSELSNGVYLLKVLSNKGDNYISKFVKK